MTFSNVYCNRNRTFRSCGAYSYLALRKLCVIRCVNILGGIPFSDSEGQYAPFIVSKDGWFSLEQRNISRRIPPFLDSSSVFPAPYCSTATGTVVLSLWFSIAFNFKRPSKTRLNPPDPRSFCCPLTFTISYSPRENRHQVRMCSD